MPSAATSKVAISGIHLTRNLIGITMSLYSNTKPVSAPDTGPAADSGAHIMKILVAIAFVLIIGSLASALVFLMRDKGKSNRTVQALTLRVGFSVTLFILLLLAY